MSSRNKSSADVGNRQTVNTQLREEAKRHVSKSSTNVSLLSADEIERLIYELEIHQEELVIQNEELRRTQLELRESADRYAELYDFAPVGYLTINPAGEIVEANLTAATLLCRDRSKLVGTRLALYCDHDSKFLLRDHLDQVFIGNQNQSCEISFIVANGGVLIARLDSNRDSATQVLNGGDYQCRMIMTDVTNRRLAENALAEKDLYLRSLVDAVPVLICHIDSELCIQFANKAYEQWFERPSDSLKGESILNTLGADFETEFSNSMKRIENGKQIDFEIQLIHWARGERDLRIMFVPDIDPNGAFQGAHVLGTDISEQKVLEAQGARKRYFGERLLRLSADERDVYELLIRGKSNKAVAFQLNIGLRTAERRRRNILDKLEFESIAELLQRLAAIQDMVQE